MQALYDRIETAADFLRRRTDVRPAWGIVLGSGLGTIADAVQDAKRIPFRDIPGFPAATVQGHRGQWVFGQLAGIPVVVLAGRLHFYEGYSTQEVTFPVRVMKALGIGRLALTSAVGGLNRAFSVGDLVIVRDHINLLPDNPLRGPNDPRLGVRFPDMLDAYDPALVDKALHLANRLHLPVHTGVMAACQGPALETPAEYAFLHGIGADLVGMSLVPEVIVARHADLRVFATTVVTDIGYPPAAIESFSHETVLAAASAASGKVLRLLQALLSDTDANQVVA
jgi:purine-nucleoside phosphorylase